MSETRAIAAFTGVGLLLVGVAVAVSRLGPEKSPVEGLPTVTTATVVVAAGIPPRRPGRRRRARPAAPAPEPVSHADRVRLRRRDLGRASRGRRGAAARHRAAAQQPPDLLARRLADRVHRRPTSATPTSTSCPRRGGEPHRLTYHPGGDAPVGWTPDGKRILFRSMRATPRDLPKLFTVSLDGWPAGAAAAAVGRRGQLLARRQAARVRPVPPVAARLEEIPRRPDDARSGSRTSPTRTSRRSRAQNSNDRYPDVGRRHGLLRLRPQRAVHAVLVRHEGGAPSGSSLHNPDGFDVRSASAGPGAHRLRAARRASTSTTSRAGPGARFPSPSPPSCRRCAPASSRSTRRAGPRTPRSRRRASASSSRRTARSSRCRPRRATRAT